MPAIKLDYAIRETKTNMKRNVFMALAAVMVVAVSLFLAGGVFLVIRSLNRAVNLQTRKVEVGVFLARDVTDEQRRSIQSDLVAMPEVKTVIYESKQEAFERFKVLFADSPEIVENVRADSLPESFRVKLKDPKRFSVVRDRLSQRPGIDTIQDQRRFLNRFLDVAVAIGGIGLFLMFVFMISAFVLIATTIRMAIYARRKEIAIMKLVGATNWFIRVPFMLEGVVQGLVGAAIAMIFLLATQPLVTKIFKIFRFLGVSVSLGEILQLSFFLAFVGMLIGGIGSLFGLRRFLEV